MIVLYIHLVNDPLFLGIIDFQDHSSMTVFAYDVRGNLIPYGKTLLHMHMALAFLNCRMPNEFICHFAFSCHKLAFDFT